MKITHRGLRATRKPATPSGPPDPFGPIAASRVKDRADMVKLRVQLEKLVAETQRAIQASRVKFHAARWKILNKSLDD